MTRPSTPPRALAGLAALGAGLALLVSSPAQAVPTAVVVAPLTAGDGDAVQVSGTGCSGPVEVTLTVPDAAGTGTEVADHGTLTPEGDGSWLAELIMQGSAAVVLASCDGADSDPVVVGDGGSGTDVARSTITSTGDVQVDVDGLDPGSLVRLVRPDGQVVGETGATPGGHTTLTVPGPGDEVLVVLGLLDGVPVTELVQTPVGATLSVAPRVTTSGSTVVVSGEGCRARGSGTARVRAVGESESWYDLPPVYLVVAIPVEADGSWATSFVMPPEAVEVDASCQLDGTYHRLGSELEAIGAIDAPSDVLRGKRIGDDVEVSGSSWAKAFATDGRELVIEQRPYPEVDRVLDAPDQFMVLDWVSFGENADPEAVVGGSVVAHLYDLRPSAPPEAPGAGEPPAAAPVRDGAELANTGSAAPGQAALAAALLVVGTGCALVSRRRGSSSVAR